MAYPSPERVWYKKSTSLATSGVVSDNRRLLLAIKNGLTQASGWVDMDNQPVTHPKPWTVAQSSNAVQVGASDYWNSESDIVWGSNLSWTCLRHPSHYGGLGELLLGCGTSSTSNGYVRYASHGFNLNGTVSANPTQYVIPELPGDPTPYKSVLWSWLNSTQWHRYGYGNNPFNAAVHIWHSADGTGTRLLVMQNGAPGCFMMWDQAVDLLGTADSHDRAYWPDGYVHGMWLAGNTLDDDAFNATSDMRAIIRAIGLDLGWLDANLGCCSLWHMDNSSMDRIPVANEMSGNWTTEPMHLYSWPGGARGLAGRLRDTWLVAAASGGHGTLFNSGALVKVGSLLLPWDGSTFDTGV